MKKFIFILIILVLFICQLYARVQDPSPPSITAESKLKPTGETIRDWPHPIKWDQMDGIDSYSGASFICYDEPADALTADDFECTETGWITDIHFAGYSYYGNEWINQFRVTIWSDFPATPDDESHPDLLLWEVYVDQADPLDPLGIGWTDLADGTFRINLPESEWFYQEGTDTAPIIYWIGIQGVMVDDAYADYFYWNFRDRYIQTWNDDAAFYSEYYGYYPPWYNWGWVSVTVDLYDGPFPVDWDSSADMAFRLSGIAEQTTIKWGQLPDLTPTGMDIDATWQPEDPDSLPILLADDFLCTESGPITDIHFWGSWLNDMPPYGECPEAVEFTLSIHSDIPASQSPTGYSMPGDTLWMKTWTPTYDDVEWINSGPEDWYNPYYPEWLNDNHLWCYKYNFYLNPEDYFYQQGSPDLSIVYWLDIQAKPLDESNPDIRFGWKTSLDHWNDDAVWGIGQEPFMGPWNELRYPPGHEYEYDSIDLAFVITTEEEPTYEYDYGDAPDPTYPTLLANIGASHIIDGVTYMGALIDAEPDGLQSPDALGDDWNNLDDEDGVTFTSILVQGYTTYVTVNASVDGVLNAWVDFNGNGDWADSNEQIFNNVSLAAGDNNLSFSVPTGAVLGTTFARFRFNTTGGLTYTGQASNGEVEDYQVIIHEPIEDSKMHFPQWPDPSGWDVHCTEPNIIADDWTCIESGPVTDIHFWVSWFTGDGSFSLIDSIHISIHENIPAGSSYSMPGTLLWQRNFKQGEFDYEEYGQGLQGWYDPVHDPVIVIPGDHEYFDLINLTNIPDPFYQIEGTIYWLDVSIFLDPEYSGYKLGWKTSQHHWEDLAVYRDAAGNWIPLYDPLYPDYPLDMAFVITGSVQPDELDLGDAPDDATAPGYPTLLANSGANHTIVPGVFLGATVDAEPDGQPSPAAVGDDNNPFPSDEDGVVFATTLVPGNQAEVVVEASVDGYLNAWVDFNGDKDWAGEQIFADKQLLAGSNIITFNVPASALTGTTFARFRFTTYDTYGSLTYKDGAIDGEVEDYLIEISADSCKMHFVQWPDLTTNGVDVFAMEDTTYMEGEILADDFFCTETGYITDIHIWGSWVEDWYEPDNMPPFTLGIWSDQLAGPGYSQPDSLLWEMTFGPTEYEWMLYAETDGEWFYSPGWQQLTFPGDSLVFKFDFYIDETEAFIQQDSTIYWLSVKALRGGGYEPIFGWKSSINHWNDDAVWYYWFPSSKNKSAKLLWNELLYPEGHPLYSESMDLAFFISSTPVPEPELDFGDAPDPPGATMYPTTLANNGARHMVDYVTYLGAQIDAEADGWQSPDALGDDTHDLPDEDGVIFKPIITGSPAQVIVTTSTPGYLQGWMDFNDDGDWIDPNEQIFADSYIHFASTVCLNYYVPATADTGYTFARFRFSTYPGLADSGLAADGEVEDYKVEIIDSSDVKWSQLPCEELPGLHSHDYSPPYQEVVHADDWLCNGGLVTDIHWWGNYEVDAFGAEIRGSGINHFHLSIHNNNPTGGCIPLDPEIWGVDVPFASVYETDTGLLNSEGCKIYMYEYYLDIPFEQIEDEYYWLDICAYSNDPADYAIWRWQESARRYTPILCGAAEKLLPTPGTWLTVQWGSTPPYRYSDMAFEITSEELPTQDFGDAPDSYKTLLATNGARHTVDYMVYLGDLIDAEPDGLPTITALGDDWNNLDDEDGVVFTCPLIPGEQGAITVTTNSAGSAYLNSWIDFNGNGDWSDAGEHFLIDQSLFSGIHSLNFNVPIGATIDSTYARFRFCTVAGLADTGFAPDGEVEDYRIEISEIPDDDCKMHFHQWPDTTSFGVDVCVTQDYEMTRIVADDFLCMETGPINSIHIWGSWKFDCPPPPSFASFQLSIWSDNPSGPNGWSEPAAFLWEKMFFPGEYLEEPYYYVPDGEHWYDPCTGYLGFPGDYTVWKYDFTIPNVDAFTQVEGNTYWLSVKAIPEIPETQFGWKSSVNHWNDDAVYQCMFPFDPWTEMIYPYGHPFNLSGEEHVSMDMAFYINCEPSTPIVSISVSSDTVYVSWDPIPCADSYTVYSSIDPYAAFPSAWTVEQAGITTTSWCENVSGTTKKFYRVVAIK